MSFIIYKPIPIIFWNKLCLTINKQLSFKEDTVMAALIFGLIIINAFLVIMHSKNKQSSNRTY